MERNRSFIIWSSILLMVSGCTKSKVSVEELRQYSLAEENGLIKSVEHGDVKINVMYRPVELLVSLDTSPRSPDWEWELSSYIGHHFFLMQLSIAGRDLETAFAERGNLELVKSYLEKGIAGDISISSENEIIHPETATYVSSFGSATVSSILISFGRDLELNEDFVLVYQDKLLTNRSYEFLFEIGDIITIPQVRTE